MKSVLTIALACLSLSMGGCAADCGPAQQMNGHVYEVFSHPMSVSSDNLEALTAAPDFLSYEIPVNGASTWEINWDSLGSGPVTVLVDGQEFDAEGEWDTLECGHFTIIGLSGLYASETADHQFNANLTGVFYADAFEALVQWTENWSVPGGASGSYRTTAQMRGTRSGGE